MMTTFKSCGILGVYLPLWFRLSDVDLIAANYHTGPIAKWDAFPRRNCYHLGRVSRLGGPSEIGFVA